MADRATVTPHEAAQLVGTTVHTIRRWCGWHGAHLSLGAHPGTNAPRRLTSRDVEVLKAVRDLRLQGLTTPAINDRLANMAFPDEALTESPQAAQESPQQTETALAVVNALQSALAPIESRLAALEQKTDSRLQPLESQRLRIDIVWLCVACFIAGLIIGLAVWWFQ